MYEKHYGLIEPPFSLTPDPKYFYRSASHTRAFELLQYGIERREGFMLVCGDIGTGKTTLCRTVLAAIDEHVHTALLLNPFLSEIDLIKAILEDFDVKLPGRKGDRSSLTKQDLINALNDFLLKTLASGGRAVVLIDEAQNIPMATLEQIRILSNLETNKEKLLQIVLVGQLNLIDVLSQSSLRQLFQRVSIKCELSELSEAEVGDYLRHRLAVAGASPSTVSFRTGRHQGGIRLFRRGPPVDQPHRGPVVAGRNGSGRGDPGLGSDTPGDRQPAVEEAEPTFSLVENERRQPRPRSGRPSCWACPFFLPRPWS